MHFWLLTDLHTQALKITRFSEEIEKLGYSVEVVAIENITQLDLTAGQSIFAENKQPANNPDQIINICSSGHEQPWMEEVVSFFELHYPVTNSRTARKLADNQWHTLQLLHQNKVPTIPTQLFSSGVDTASLASNLIYPVILKKTHGHKGKNVYLCQNKAELKSTLQHHFQTDQVLLQKFMAAQPERNIRALVVGNEVVAAMHRAAPSHILSEINQPKIAKSLVTLTENQHKITVAASQALGLTYSGMDLLYTDDGGVVVCEINANPGLGIEEVTGINVVARICQVLSKPTN